MPESAGAAPPLAGAPPPAPQPPEPPGPPLASIFPLRWLGPAVLLAVVAAAILARLPMAAHPWFYTGNDPYALHETVRAWLHGQASPDGFAFPAGVGLVAPPLLPALAVLPAAVLRLAVAEDPAITIALNAVMLLHVALLGVATWSVVRRHFGRLAGLFAVVLVLFVPPLVSRSVWIYPDDLVPGLAWTLTAFALFDRAHPVFAGAGTAAQRRRAAWPVLVAAGASGLAWPHHAVLVLGLTVTALAWQVRLGRGQAPATWLAAAAVGACLAAGLPWTLGHAVHVLWLEAICLALLAAAALAAARVAAGAARPAAAAALGILVASVLFVDEARSAALLWTATSFDARLSSTIAEAQPGALPDLLTGGPWLPVAAAAALVRIGIRYAKGAAAPLALAVAGVVGVAAAMDRMGSMAVALSGLAVLAGIGAAWPLQALLTPLDRQPLSRRTPGLVGAFLLFLLLGATVLGPAVASGFQAGNEQDHDWSAPYEGRVYSEAYASRDLAQVPGQCWTTRIYQCGTPWLGVGSELEGNGWMPTLQALAARDAHLPLGQRPAVMAWWDYGDWIVSLGKHPAVADPNSGEYLTASHVLGAGSEDEAQGWILLHLIAAHAQRNGGILPPTLGAILAEGPDGLAARSWHAGNADDHAALMGRFPGEAIHDVYQRFANATGHHVGYVIVEDRMAPTPRYPGILYAPLFLAGKDPDDYLQQRFLVDTESYLWAFSQQEPSAAAAPECQPKAAPRMDETARTTTGESSPRAPSLVAFRANGTAEPWGNVTIARGNATLASQVVVLSSAAHSRAFTLRSYGRDADGRSVHLEQPTFVDDAGQVWRDHGGLLCPEDAAACLAHLCPVYILGPEQVRKTDLYRRSFFAQAYGDPETGVEPAAALKHWRVVHKEPGPPGFAAVAWTTVLLEYVPS